MRSFSSIPRLGLFAILILQACSLPIAHGQSAVGRVLSAEEKTKLLAQATVAQKAVNACDVDAAMKTMPPVLVRMVGGEENLRRQLTASFAVCEEEGMRFLETTFGEPTLVHDAGPHEVCFVPRTSIMQTKSGKVRSQAFWVAVRETAGGEWKFLDGAPMQKNPKALWGLFPELPQGLVFPEWKQEAMK